MEHLQHYIYELEDLIKAADDVSGEWNGDKPGLQEERATIANEISEKAKEIKVLLEQLKEIL